MATLETLKLVKTLTDKQAKIMGREGRFTLTGSGVATIAALQAKGLLTKDLGLSAAGRRVRLHLFGEQRAEPNQPGSVSIEKPEATPADVSPVEGAALPGVEICKMMTLSTSHVTDDTCNSYLLGYTGPVFRKDEYGWFIYVGEDTSDLPTDLEACLQFARFHGCVWLCLDCDGPVIESLPTFEW